jgi:MFS family permease
MQVSVIMLGGSNIIWVPLANVFGRRPILIIAPLIMTLGSLGCALSKSFTALLASRAVQGLGGGPADTIAADILGDIFFVHQRGRAMVSTLPRLNKSCVS